MKELRRILARARQLRTTGTPAVLATIVAVEGSAYRREGARLLNPLLRAAQVTADSLLTRRIAEAEEAAQHHELGRDGRVGFQLEHPVPVRALGAEQVPGGMRAARDARTRPGR